MSSSSYQVTYIKHIYTLSEARRQPVRVVKQSQVAYIKHVHNQRREDNSSMLSNLSKSNNIHQTYLSIHNQWPEDNLSMSSNLSEKYTLYISIQSEARWRLVCVLQLVKAKYNTLNIYTIIGKKTTPPCRLTWQCQEKYIKHIYTQSEAMLYNHQLMKQTSNIFIYFQKPKDTSTIFLLSSILVHLLQMQKS